MGIGMLRKVDGEMESVREEGRGSEAGPLPGVGIAELSALRNVFDARCLCYKKREREKDAVGTACLWASQPVPAWQDAPKG